MGILVNVLMYALPSGFLGAALSWVINRRKNKAAERESIEFAYKHLYLSLKSEVAALNKEVLFLKSKYREASNCTHYNDGCPLNLV